LALVNKMVEPKLKHLEDWYQHNSYEIRRPDKRHEIIRQYPNAENLFSVNLYYKLFTFWHCSAHFLTIA
jgi:hypothetical protein